MPYILTDSFCTLIPFGIKKKCNVTLKGQVAIVTEANDWKIRLCKTILETYDKWFQPCQLLVYRIKYSCKILYIFNCKSIIHKLSKSKCKTIISKQHLKYTILFTFYKHWYSNSRLYESPMDKWIYFFFISLISCICITYS